MYDLLLKKIDQFVEMSPEEKEILSSKFFLRSIKKNEVLLPFGDICKDLYFINKGLIRFYYPTDDGKEITGFIFEEGLFATSNESFFTQTPSLQILESLEEGEVLCISYQRLMELFQLVPKTIEFVMKISIRRMSEAQKVVASLIMHKPEDRYISFLEKRPDLAGRIPQGVLATYLGITPVSLSRIRKRITEKGD